MYKLKDNVDPNEIIRKRNELVENSSSGFTTYSNYLARIIVMGNNLLEGKKPVIKDVKKLEYKHGKLILQK
jgi:ferritin-like protein